MRKKSVVLRYMYTNMYLLRKKVNFNYVTEIYTCVHALVMRYANVFAIIKRCRRL